MVTIQTTRMQEYLRIQNSSPVIYLIIRKLMPGTITVKGGTPSIEKPPVVFI